MLAWRVHTLLARCCCCLLSALLCAAARAHVCRETRSQYGRMGSELTYRKSKETRAQRLRTALFALLQSLLLPAKFSECPVFTLQYASQRCCRASCCSPAACGYWCLAVRAVKSAFCRVKVGAGGGAVSSGDSSCSVACEEVFSLLLWLFE